MTKLDADLLRRFMMSFFGYGSWDANLWFVGMEEGGGDSLEEIDRRLRAWDGSDDLSDLYAFHRAIGVDRWFRQRPQIQNTWGKLIRIALAAEGQPADAESVRRYQRDTLGRINGDAALIELFPLPSPSAVEWMYGETGVPDLATRALYRSALAPSRIAELRRRIVTHHPHAVVFYGTGYRAYWDEIAGMPMRPVDGHRFDAARAGATLFIVTPHPVGYGITNRQFEEIGEFIRQGMA